MCRLIEQQVAVELTAHTSLGASRLRGFLLLAIANLAPLCLTADERPRCGGVFHDGRKIDKPKSHTRHNLLHIPLKARVAIANSAQGGVVLHRQKVLHPAKS